MDGLGFPNGDGIVNFVDPQPIGRTGRSGYRGRCYIENGMIRMKADRLRVMRGRYILDDLQRTLRHSDNVAEGTEGLFDRLGHRGCSY